MNAQAAPNSAPAMIISGTRESPVDAVHRQRDEDHPEPADIGLASGPMLNSPA